MSLREPAPFRSFSAAIIRSRWGRSTAWRATAALSAACRDMAMNLAMLMMHAEAACHSMGDIGDTAEALVKTGSDLQQVAETFQQDHDRMSTELTGLAAGHV